MCQCSGADAMRRDPRQREDRPLRLLFVGRIEAEKGVPELLEAAELLSRRGVTFELKLVGLGALSEELSARFPGDVPGLIRVLGAVEDRAKLMQMFGEADVFVLPTHHEGFPRVLYEAMIKSTAVITTMVGGIPGLMRDGENCLAVRVKDAEGIADAVNRLANDPGLLHALGAAGLATAIDVLENNVPHAEALQRELAEDGRWPETAKRV
jgi:glycosyltransferase involved in cell wall biosynthesis